MRYYAEAGEPGFELACPYTTNAYLWGAPFLRLNTPLTRSHFKGGGLINTLVGCRKIYRTSPTGKRGSRALLSGALPLLASLAFMWTFLLIGLNNEKDSDRLIDIN